MIELQNENLTLCVDLLGAQMMELRSRHGTQFLWNGDAKYWRDRAPVLFPYVARLTDGSYTLYGERYSMDIHGFAKDSVSPSKNSLPILSRSACTKRRKHCASIRSASPSGCAMHCAAGRST